MRGKNDRHNAKRRGNDTDEEVKREKKQKKREAKKKTIECMIEKRLYEYKMKTIKRPMANSNVWNCIIPH